MRKLRFRKIQPLWPECHSSDPQAVWFQSLCFFLPHQSVLKREQVLLWWKQAWIYPSALGSWKHPWGQAFREIKHSRHTRLQTASCAQGLTLFCTLLYLDILILCDPGPLYPSSRDTRTLLVSNFIAITTGQTKSRVGRRLLLTCLCEQYNCWTYFLVNIHLILKLSERRWKCWTRHCFLCSEIYFQVLSTYPTFRWNFPWKAENEQITVALRI